MSDVTQHFPKRQATSDKRHTPSDKRHPPPLRLAVLVSGGGTTLQGLIDAIAAGSLGAEIALVVSSRRDAFALERARRSDIPTCVLSRRAFTTPEQHDAALAGLLQQHQVDLVVLAGYLLPIGQATLSAFPGRIINIHPSLLPAFGGRGYYGSRVHTEVLEHGCKITGATVHFVEAELDTGPIILQGAVEIEDDDTSESLAAKVGELERELYPRAIQLFADGKLRQVGRRVTILK
ncbi:MAG: phosphoribosylglycinamide formyltransferase [Selenomonadales bacterium]|nr:phosphoribosylglycinamide formyltransferase [Selenomonadales bacterium]